MEWTLGDEDPVGGRGWMGGLDAPPRHQKTPLLFITPADTMELADLQKQSSPTLKFVLLAACVCDSSPMFALLLFRPLPVQLSIRV